MSYVVYVKETTRLLRTKSGTIHSTAAAAKSHITRLVNAGKYERNELAFAESWLFFREIEKTRKVKNLMTGVEVELPFNTPMACDPSTETYWSM